MAKIFGSLESASLESRPDNTTPATQGRIFWNTSLNQIILDDGVNKRAVLRNDGKAVFGTDATAANNIRLHHAGQSLLQFVTADDTTAENTLSASPAQLALKLQNVAAAPTPGIAGRVVFNTATSGAMIDTGSTLLQLATLTGTETLTNKSLSAPAITDFIALTDQGTTPTAQAGKTLLFTQGGQPYKLGADGLVTLVGSGASGGAGFNYLTNGDVEQGITTYQKYASTALTAGLPSGTGPVITSTPNSITLSAETQNPLRRTTSLKATAATAWTAGQGFPLSDPFTLQQNDLGKVLNFTVNYRVVSGGNTLGWTGTPGTQGLFVAVYDLTASQWVNGGAIPGAFGFNQASGTGQMTATFQTGTAVGQQYQAFIFNGVTSTAAVTVLFDEMSIMPNAQNSADSRAITFTGNVSTTTAMTANSTLLPLTSVLDRAGGWSINQYLVPVQGDYQVNGSLIVSTSGNVVVFVNGVLKSYIGSNATGATARIVLSSFLSNLPANAVITFRTDANMTITANAADFISLTRVGGQSGNTPDARVVVGKFGGASGNINNAGGANTPYVFNSVIADSFAGFSTASGRYSVPISGFFEVTFSGSSVGGAVTISVFKNAVSDTSLVTLQSDGLRSGSTIVSCNANDILDLRGDNNIALSQGSRFVVKRVTGPSSVAASESFNATYALGATQSVATTSVIKFDARQRDTHSFYSPTTGLATIPASGQWRISVVGQTSTTSSIYALINGQPGSFLTTMSGLIQGGSFSAFLQAGTTVGIYAETACNVNGGIVANRGYLSQCTFERTGN